MEIWKDCWSCKNETPQERIYFKIFPRPVEGFIKDPRIGLAISFWTISIDTYQFSECRKCKAPILHIDVYKIKTNKENIEKLADNIKELHSAIEINGSCKSYDYESFSYPNFDTGPLKEKKWSFNLPEEDMILYFEVISAWDKGLFILALSGIRTLVDRYIVKKIGDIGNFKDKLKKMLVEQHINQQQYNLLGTVIEAGNAAGHRGFKPDKEMLDNLLMVVEDIMSLEYRTLNFDEYKKSIPKRVKK